MGSATQDVVFGITGQRLHYDAPEGRPQSVVAVAVWPNALGESGVAEAALDGTAEVEEDPDTTVDESSGVHQDDPRRIALASVAGIAVGRRYLLTSTLGEQEWVEVAALGAGYVISKHDLDNEYLAGSTFETTRISIALDDAWMADPLHRSWDLAINPTFRVRWHYIDAFGGPVVVDTYFDVLEYAARYSVTALDVDVLQPGWIDRLPRSDQADQGRTVIRSAYNKVKWDLYGDGVADQTIRNRELFEELIAARAAADVVPSQSNVERYQRLYQLLIRSGLAPIGTEGPTVPVERRPLWER